MGGSCLIVGAGMSGLSAASELTSRGWTVSLVDKGRRPGGRMATRRIGGRPFDHGAQFFTVRDKRFRQVVSQWETAGWVKPWFTLDGHTRYYAVDGMNALAKRLAGPFQINTEIRIEHIGLIGGKWVATAAGVPPFTAGALLMTPPAAQTLALLNGVSSEMPTTIANTLACIEYDPCFALMAVLDGPGNVPKPGFVRPEECTIDWIADNAMKGVCEGTGALTIHARADFTRRHFNSAKEHVAHMLLQAATPYLGSAVVEWQFHRWLYSKPMQIRNDLCLYTDFPAPLAIAGDAFAGSRVEGAFLSGLAAAEAICQKA